MTKLDMWAGRTLFVPLIIKVCHLTNSNQHRVASYTEFFGWLFLFASLMKGDAPLWVTIMFGAVAGAVTLAFLLRAALMPDKPMEPSAGGFREIGLLLLALEIVFFVLAGIGDGFAGLVAKANYNDLVWPLWLTSQYARLIDRLPPKPSKRKKASGKLVPSKVTK